MSGQQWRWPVAASRSGSVVSGERPIAARTNDEVSETATGVCTLAPLFDGIVSVTSPFFGVCTLDLAWAPATPECGADVTYNVYRSTTPSFAPGPANRLAGGLTSTVLSDVN